MLKIEFCELTFEKISKFSFTGLVYFHSIRAKWNKKISVKATVKPCIPSNRVFGGSTFDFR